MRISTHGVLALGSLLGAAAAFAADFSGTWNISSKVGDNPVSIQCTLVQRDNALTGTCKPAQFDPSSTTGTVSGTKATWGYDVVFNGNKARVDYVAELAADGTLKGNVLRNGSPSPITGKKQ